jgi:hypothetical protein
MKMPNQKPTALAERAIPTKRLLLEALASGRFEEAARLADRLPAEWEEIRILYPEFLRRTIAELRRRVGDAMPLNRFERQLVEELGGDYEASPKQEQLDRESGDFAAMCAKGAATTADLEALFATWRQIHDRWRDLLSGVIDLGVELLGEERLGDLWAAIQKDEIEGYKRYDPAQRPWAESFEEVVEIAISGMHGHMCGPKFDGEIGVVEDEDKVELRFSPCGSGGRIRDEDRFGVTAGEYDWGWSKQGVCYYCVHCCVLQQLTPIDNFGTPVRVIEPPTEPGDSCSWTVYRSLDRVPDSAYEAVGRPRPAS